MMRERILLSLGLSDTTSIVPDEKAGRFASCYVLSPEGRVELQNDPVNSAYRVPPQHALGGGGLVSTGPDYLRFCQLLFNNGLHDREYLVCPHTIHPMCTNQPDPSGKQ